MNPEAIKLRIFRQLIGLGWTTEDAIRDTKAAYDELFREGIEERDSLYLPF